MKITSKGRYALSALLDLINNSNGNPIRLQDISERQNISVLYLEKLFKELRTKGVVKSVRGPGGGYLLIKNPQQVNLFEILKAVDEDINYDSMQTDTKEAVAVNHFLKELENHIRSKLLISLDSLK